MIDPEHRQPYVSLARILLACAVTPVEAILRYRLDRLDYSTTLGGLAPLVDLWVPLSIARTVAHDLGVLDQLAALLDWDTRAAYSVEDKELGGLVHNWKIASDRIGPDEYSTARMLSTTFPRIHLLPAGAQVRTLLAPPGAFPASPRAGRPDGDDDDDDSALASALEEVWAQIVEWSVMECELYLDSASDADEQGVADVSAKRDENSHTSLGTRFGSHAHDRAHPATNLTSHVPPMPPRVPASPAPLFLFSTLSSFLHALHLLPDPSRPDELRPTESPHTSVAVLSHLASIPELARAALVPLSSPSSSSASEIPFPTPFSRSGRAHNVDSDPGVEPLAAASPRTSAPSSPPPWPSHATVYLADAIGRVVLFARRQQRQRQSSLSRVDRERRDEESRPPLRRTAEGAADGDGVETEAEWRARIEARLEALEIGWKADERVRGETDVRVGAAAADTGRTDRVTPLGPSAGREWQQEQSAAEVGAAAEVASGRLPDARDLPDLTRRDRLEPGDIPVHREPSESQNDPDWQRSRLGGVGFPPEDEEDIPPRSHHERATPSHRSSVELSSNYRQVVHNQAHLQLEITLAVFALGVALGAGTVLRWTS